MRCVLFVNPRSGGGTVALDDLRAAAKERGADVHVLRKREDVADLARRADVDVLGIAGGDGSLGPVAEVAVERGLPFLCLATGTRNHFATDAGLPTDPVAALAALDGGSERRVDVGRADGRLFLNNVSLGVYARLVHRRERRRRRGEAFARLRALLASLPDHSWSQSFRIDGEPVQASVVLVANNEYETTVGTFGSRPSLDGGQLALYAARGLRRLEWTERTASELVVEMRRPSMHAALDGEPARLSSPLRLWVEPSALRLLVPPATAAADEDERTSVRLGTMARLWPAPTSSSSTGRASTT